VDNGCYNETLVEKEIQVRGSATTLVLEKFIHDYPDLVDKQMALFLMAPLLLDSFNFDPTLKDSKWKNEDLEIFEFLLKKADVDRDTYFNDLQEAVADIDLNLKLGIANLLIKDYKTYRLISD